MCIKRKETTQVKIDERTVITTSNVYIYIYINKVCYHNVIIRSKVYEQCIYNIEKRKKYIKSSLHPSKYEHSP